MEKENSSFTDALLSLVPSCSDMTCCVHLYLPNHSGLKVLNYKPKQTAPQYSSLRYLTLSKCLDSVLIWGTTPNLHVLLYDSVCK